MKKRTYSILLVSILALLSISCPKQGNERLSPPSLLPNGGIYDEPIDVIVRSDKDYAIMYYTTDGSTPSSSNGKRIYNGDSIHLASTTTLKVISTFPGPGIDDSLISRATYTINYLEPPTIDVISGTYAYEQKVSITTSDTNAKIYYTTNGATPTSSSAEYKSPLQISTNTKIMAIAVNDNLTSSVSISDIKIYKNETENLNVLGRKNSSSGILYKNDKKIDVSSERGATEMIALGDTSFGVIGSTNTKGYFAYVNDENVNKYDLPLSGAANNLIELGNVIYVVGNAKVPNKFVQAYLFYTQNNGETFKYLCLEDENIDTYSKALGICANNNTIYVVGIKEDENSINKPYFWKVNVSNMENIAIEDKGFIKNERGEAKDIAIDSEGTFYITLMYNNDAYVLFGVGLSSTNLSTFKEALLCKAGNSGKISTFENKAYIVNNTGDMGMLYEVDKNGKDGHYADKTYSLTNAKFTNVFAKDKNNIYMTGYSLVRAPDNMATRGYSLWTKAIRNNESDYLSFGDLVFLDFSNVSGTYTERNAAVSIIVK